MFHSCRTDSRQNGATKTSAVSTLDWSIEHLAAWLALRSEASLKAALFPESTQVIYSVSEEEEADCNRGEKTWQNGGEKGSSSGSKWKLMENFRISFREQRIYFGVNQRWLWK